MGLAESGLWRLACDARAKRDGTGSDFWSKELKICLDWHRATMLWNHGLRSTYVEGSTFMSLLSITLLLGFLGMRSSEVPLPEYRFASCCISYKSTPA
ncbi:hypothetical protein SLA2020_388190 [Shorea laevis]